MSCPTATRWFVPNATWLATEIDYALIKQSANLIRREINDGNDEGPHLLEDGSPEPLYFARLLSRRRGGPYDFATPGRLLWGDVDASNPEHEKDVREAMKNVVNDREHYSEIEMQLLSAFEDKDDHHTGDDAEEPEKEDKAETVSNQKPNILDMLLRLHEEGVIEPHLLNLLLSKMKQPEKKQKAVELFTDQDSYTSKRPVMVLVGMVDSMQSIHPGEKKGWAIAYDILKDLFICKPFASNAQQHPLTGSWNTVIDDGVSSIRSPSAFIEYYIALSDEVASQRESGEIKVSPRADAEDIHGHDIDLILPDINFAWRLLVATLTANFIEDHWAGFVDSRVADEEERGALEARFLDARNHITNSLRLIRVPVVVAKAEKEEEKVCIRAFEEMEWQLEELEGYFRHCALGVKEKGHAKAAENAARLYEKVMAMVRAFNEDPEKDV